MPLSCGYHHLGTPHPFSSFVTQGLPQMLLAFHFVSPFQTAHPRYRSTYCKASLNHSSGAFAGNARCRQQPSLTETAAHAQICDCQKRRDTTRAKQIWTDFNTNASPSARLLGVYIKMLCDGGEVDLAREVLSQHAYLRGHRGRTSIIGALARVGRVDEALKELYVAQGTPEMLKPFAWTSCLHALSVAKRLDEALQLLRIADEQGVEIDMGMYDAVIRGLGRYGRVEEAFKLVAQAQREGLSLTSDTYVGLIYGCGEASMPRRALVVYDAAKAAGWGADAQVVEATASACLRQAFVDDKRVIEVVAELRKRGKGKKLRDLERLLKRRERG